MFHVPLDVVADQSIHAPADNEHVSLNLIHTERPDTIPPSPENTPSSSPASLSCSTISSLKTWRSASEQLKSPTFSFPAPVCRNFGAITANSSDELSSQYISCIQMNAFDAPSFQRPAIATVDEGELEDLRWTTGVPCHMIDVFRANPFTAMDLPHITGTTPLDTSTNPNNAECKVGGAISAAKHVLSPGATEQKGKTRAKRARIQSSSVVPFPATGPQEMFAYEFRLDIPSEGTGFSRVEEYRRCGDLPPSYPLSRDMDGREHLLLTRPVVADSSEDVSACFPVGRQDTMFENCTQRPHLFPPSVSVSTRMSLCLEDPYHPAVYAPSPQGIDESRPQFEDYGGSSLPPIVPIRVIPERPQTFRPSVAPAAPSIQKPLYACPLCPRHFQLPNGLALHRKWHDRVGPSATNPNSRLNYRPQDRVPPKISRRGSSRPEARDMKLTQLPTQHNNQRSTIAGLPSTSYIAPQGVITAQAEFMMSSNHEQYTATSALSYDRQHQECALFHDVLQLNHNVNFSLDNNTYLAPLDGLSVLQPLPFEQCRCHSTTGQLCSLPSS